MNEVKGREKNREKTMNLSERNEGSRRETTDEVMALASSRHNATNTHLLTLPTAKERVIEGQPHLTILLGGCHLNYTD